MSKSNCVTVNQFELTKMWVARVEVGIHLHGADNLLIMHLHGADNLLLMHATHMVSHLLL